MNLSELPEPTDSAAALAAVVALRRTADRLELASVRCAIEEGWTWAQVAEALGVSRQAVHKRYARRIDEAPPAPRRASKPPKHKDAQKDRT